MNDSVLLDVRDGIATLTFNRPEALNTLDVAAMQAFRGAVERIAADSAIEVVVITGAGAHFMAGGDIRQFGKIVADYAGAQRLQQFQAMIEQWINPAILLLQNLHQPVVAKVRGACAGIGLSFMSGCDIVIAADDAVFSTAYSAIGLSPDGGASWFLPRNVGTRRALEMFLLGDRFDAQTAQSIGLVTRVVAGVGLDAAVSAVVHQLKNGPRHSYGEIKRLVRASGCNTLEAQLALEGAAFARCSATNDFAEGVKSFLEKRKPQFSGR